jgi:two-component system sensor histidine kinase AlgZ
MLAADKTRFPSFWRLQIAGWASLYALVMLAAFPHFDSPEVVRYDNLACAVGFLASLLLRPVCRASWQKASSWFALEMRAFAFSLALGSVNALVCEVGTHGAGAIDWEEWLASAITCSMTLFLWCSLYFSIKQWLQSVEERERLLCAESAAREARLSALRYQLNPHFLFNSLNAVSTLVLEGNAPAATRMLAQIGELLRASLDSEIRIAAPLSEEITFIKMYLAIELTRLGERLQVDWSIASETLDALVPNMILQPLVENAVRHGVAPLTEGGRITIQSKLHDARLQIIIRNSGRSGAGMTAAPCISTKGIGIANTRERLKTLYGADHHFALEWPAEGGCVVMIELPFRKSDREEGAAA